jgi:hypothetical protein
MPTNFADVETATALTQNGQLLCGERTDVMPGSKKDMALPKCKTRSEIPIRPSLCVNQHGYRHDLDRKLGLCGLVH